LRSNVLARELSEWLRNVIQSTEPFFSAEDITKGTRWAIELAGALEVTDVGLLCLTSENLDSKWVMFEAGALSKSVDTSRVCPILFGLSTRDLEGPLSQFQAAEFTKLDMKRVIEMINEALDQASLRADLLDRAFDQWWPGFKERVQDVIQASVPTEVPDARTDPEVLNEILRGVRSLVQRPTITRESLEALAAGFGFGLGVVSPSAAQSHQLEDRRVYPELLGVAMTGTPEDKQALAELLASVRDTGSTAGEGDVFVSPKPASAGAGGTDPGVSISGTITSGASSNLPESSA